MYKQCACLENES